MPGENILQTLQRIMTVTHQLQELAKEVDTLRADLNARLEKYDS